MIKEGKIILLIEDNKDFSELLTSYLVTHDFDVVVVNNGIEGVKALDKLEPDLILLDVSIPEMDGIQFYRYLLTDSGRPKYPVIVMTVKSELERVFKDVDVDGFLRKPFDMDELLKKIDSVLSGELNYNVFIIDPSNSNHLLKVKKLLISERYNVIHCGNYIDFKKIANNKKVDLILIEYKQSDMPAEHLVAKLRYEEFDTVPVFIYSFTNLVNKNAELFLKDQVRYIEQPLDYQNFLKVVRESELINKQKHKKDL